VSGLGAHPTGPQAADPIVLRAATEGDLDGAVDVYLAARHAAVPAIPPLVHADHDVRTWFREAVWPRHELWIADTDRTVVGLLVLDGGQVDHLYVAPSQAGRGIGSALLDKAKSLRPRGLTLWVFQSNVDARRFYRRHGFVERARTNGSGNEERSPDVRYAWPGTDQGTSG